MSADLHDGVGASLSRIAILTDVVKQQAERALPGAIPALAAIGCATERLEISVNTVRSYVRTTYDKLHVHSKSEAVSTALRSGLIA